MAVALETPPQMMGGPKDSLEMIYREEIDSNFIKRSRSLPPEEFAYLTAKLKELDLVQRTDSLGSGRTRDSGFNSEIPSCGCGIVGEQQELPSALLASDLNSGFLAQYGLDGPLDEYPDDPEEELEGGGLDLLGMPPAPSVTSINTKRKRKEDLKQATIRQHYYPEGGWGFVVVLVAILVQIITHGLQLSFGVLALAISRRWSTEEADFIQISALGGLSLSLGLIFSPLTVGVCKRKSTRLTAVIGGLVLALGCLFSSFANQFHQLFFSHAIMTGIGVGLTRDTSTLMVAQYFKRRREFVEIFVVAASGLGIALMSTFIFQATSTAGWRLGLQQITGLLITTFLLGTFYRSASLYHPQRRAILHLKTQKRKIKNKDKEKNKLQDDRPPFFEFTTLRSRTVQIILLSTFLSHVGIFTPLFLLATEAQFTKDLTVQLQTFLGIAWALGSGAFGLVMVGQSAECRIARQYLTQASLVLSGLSIFSLTAVRGSYSGYVMFAWIYGVFNGGYAYTLKMYIYEKVRARNFARAWSFAQMAMGCGAVLGLPLATWLSKDDSNLGYHFSASIVVIGGMVLSCVDFHKKRLRKKRRLRQCKSTASTATAATSTTFNSTTGTIHRHLYSSHSQSIDTPKNSGIHDLPSSHSPILSQHPKEFPSEHHVSEVGLPIVEASASGNDAGKPIIFVVRSHSDATAAELPKNKKHQQLQRLMSLDMMEQGEDIIQELDEIMEDEDELLINEEIDFLEGITSCNKVENCVIMSEYEQNLMKENSEMVPLNGRRMRDPATKKWFHQKKNHPETLAHRGKKWNQVLPGPSKEMATVIEETTSTV